MFFKATIKSILDNFIYLLALSHSYFLSELRNTSEPFMLNKQIINYIIIIIGCSSGKVDKNTVIYNTNSGKHCIFYL